MSSRKVPFPSPVQNFQGTKLLTMQAGHSEVKRKSVHASCRERVIGACWFALAGNKKSHSDFTQIKSRTHAGPRSSQQHRICSIARTSHDFRLAAPDYAG